MRSFDRSEGSDSGMEKGTMGKSIAAKRKELGMTQLDLAEKMGVTDKAVSKWERDLSCPDIGTLPRLAELLGLSVDELLQINGEGARRPVAIPAEHIISLILRAVCTAMGIAVVVLSILDRTETRPAIIMLGIGLACAGIDSLRKK